MSYEKVLVDQFWKYAADKFDLKVGMFDRAGYTANRPPVFNPEFADENLIYSPDSSREEKNELTRLLPRKERHRWFRSMKSSQALAQSLFGNLILHERTDALNGLTADEGGFLFAGEAMKVHYELEASVSQLNEPRPTSVDVLIKGDYSVAIECKFAETGVGTCSRPRLTPKDTNYITSHCDGSFTRQRGREHRCSLANEGIDYWKHVPSLFDWSATIDHTPCPMKDTYQLVRNILAARVREDRTISAELGHAVLIYDKRNPWFQESGSGRTAYKVTKQGLQYPGALRRCSWQKLTKHLRAQKVLPWLLDEITEKYGI